jgi:hypothetical protein
LGSIRWDNVKLLLLLLLTPTPAMPKRAHCRGAATSPQSQQ